MGKGRGFRSLPMSAALVLTLLAQLGNFAHRRHHRVAALTTGGIGGFVAPATRTGPPPGIGLGLGLGGIDGAALVPTPPRPVGRGGGTTTTTLSATSPRRGVGHRRAATRGPPRNAVRGGHDNADSSSDWWCSFKDVMYGSYDALSTPAVVLLRKHSGNNDGHLGRTGKKSSTSDDDPYVLYSDEDRLRTPLSTSSINVKRRNGEMESPPAPVPASVVIREYENVGNYRRRAPPALVDPPPEKPHIMVEMKDGLYGLTDSLFGRRQHSKTTAVSTAKRLNGGGKARRMTPRPPDVPYPQRKLGLKPLTKTSRNVQSHHDAAPTGLVDGGEIHRLIMQRDHDTNPISRWVARIALERMERRRVARVKAEGRERAFLRVKAIWYNNVDLIRFALGALVNTLEAVASAPRAIADAADRAKVTAESTVRFVEGAIDGVRATPERIQATAVEIQRAAENATRFATEVVDGVVSLPETVRRTVRETEDRIVSVRREVRYLTGMERRPVPPPPPPTGTEVALKVTGQAVTGAAKLAWFVGKNAVGAGAWGARTAFDAAVDERNRREAAGVPVGGGVRAVSNLTATSPAAAAPRPPVNATSSVSADAALDREVEDALQLAQEALERSTSKESPSDVLAAEDARSLSKSNEDELERARIEEERRREEERIASEKAERVRFEKEKAELAERKRLAVERDRLERARREEEERAATAKAERARLAKRKAEEEKRIAVARAVEEARLAAEKELILKEKKKQERLSKLKTAEEQAAAQAEARKADAELERVTKLKAEENERTRLAAEKAKLQKERLAEENRVAELEAEKEEQERIATERIELEQERLERERIAAEKAKKIRLEKFKEEEAKKIAAERAAEEEARVRREQERLAAEEAERERVATLRRQESEKIAIARKELERIATLNVREEKRLMVEDVLRKARLEEKRRREEERVALAEAERSRLEGKALMKKRLAAQKEGVAAQKAEQDRIAMLSFLL